MTVPVLRPVQHWYCPACRLESVTYEAKPHTRMHVCRARRSLTFPMLPLGVKAKIEVIEREDYVGSEQVQVDPERGRPVQSVVITRDQGQDTTVFAPTATLGGSIH